jgi:hypothetical protein
MGYGLTATVRLHRLMTAVGLVEDELEALRREFGSQRTDNDFTRHLQAEIVARLDCAALDYLPELKASLMGAEQAALSCENRSGATVSRGGRTHPAGP